MITVGWFLECVSTDSSMKNAAVEDCCRRLVNEGFKMIFLDGHHCCSAVQELKTGDEHEETERPLPVTQSICRVVQGIW